MKTHYIYRITNLIDGKTYIGQRSCPENVEPENDTKYMGSGKIIKRAEKKYGTHWHLDENGKHIYSTNMWLH